MITSLCAFFSLLFFNVYFLSVASSLLTYFNSISYRTSQASLTEKKITTLYQSGLEFADWTLWSGVRPFHKKRCRWYEHWLQLRVRLRFLSSEEYGEPLSVVYWGRKWQQHLYIRIYLSSLFTKSSRNGYVREAKIDRYNDR